jgi:CRP-like cAMP-binding protein
VSYDAAPTRVKEVMLEAIRQAPLVLASPAPDVLLMQFADSSVIYRARVWVADYRYDEEAIDQVRTAIYYAFRRHGIEIPYPIAVEIGREDAMPNLEAAAARRTEALAGIPMLTALSTEERATLAAEAVERVYGVGERIVRQGDEGESMFVLLDGSARVFVEPATEVAVLETGGCFGEMSLLTGDARTASVAARTDCTVLEISPDAFNQIARTNPAAMERLAALAAERRGPLEQARLAAIARQQSVTHAGLFARMRQWISS